MEGLSALALLFEWPQFRNADRGSGCRGLLASGGESQTGTVRRDFNEWGELAKAEEKITGFLGAVVTDPCFSF
jgi:hypothetical protein